MQSNTPDTSAPHPTPFKCPVVIIPEDAMLSEYGNLEFTIPTPEGAVSVHWYHPDSVFCRGNLAALVKAGLMLPHWAPGLPGNNKISQRVVFDEEYPRLIICSKGGRPFNDPHMTIIRKSRHLRFLRGNICQTASRRR